MNFRQFSESIIQLGKECNLEILIDNRITPYYFDFYFPQLKLAVDYAEDPHDHADGYHRFVEREKALKAQSINYFYCESFDVDIRLNELKLLINNLKKS